MAILFDTASEALSRTAGTFLSNGSDWTICFWGQLTSNVTVGKWRTFFASFNAGFTGEVFIGTDATETQKLDLFVSNTVTSINQVGSLLTTGTWYFFGLTYDATSHVFNLYQGTTSANLVLAVTGKIGRASCRERV